MAVEAARAGAALAADLFRTSLDVETKASATDYVTEADTGAQRRIVDRITETFPDDAIVAGEKRRRDGVRRGDRGGGIAPSDGRAK